MRKLCSVLGKVEQCGLSFDFRAGASLSQLLEQYPELRALYEKQSDDTERGELLQIMNKSTAAELHFVPLQDMENLVFFTGLPKPTTHRKPVIEPSGPKIESDSFLSGGLRAVQESRSQQHSPEVPKTFLPPAVQPVPLSIDTSQSQNTHREYYTPQTQSPIAEQYLFSNSPIGYQYGISSNDNGRWTNTHPIQPMAPNQFNQTWPPRTHVSPTPVYPSTPHAHSYSAHSSHISVHHVVSPQHTLHSQYSPVVQSSPNSFMRQTYPPPPVQTTQYVTAASQSPPVPIVLMPPSSQHVPLYHMPQSGPTHYQTQQQRPQLSLPGPLYYSNQASIPSQLWQNNANQQYRPQTHQQHYAPSALNAQQQYLSHPAPFARQQQPHQNQQQLYPASQQSPRPPQQYFPNNQFY